MKHGDVNHRYVYIYQRLDSVHLTTVGAKNGQDLAVDYVNLTGHPGVWMGDMHFNGIPSGFKRANGESPN